MECLLGDQPQSTCRYTVNSAHQHFPHFEKDRTLRYYHFPTGAVLELVHFVDIIYRFQSRLWDLESELSCQYFSVVALYVPRPDETKETR